MSKLFRSKSVRLAMLYLVTIGFLLATDPTRLPSVPLILPFVGVFCCLYATIMALMHFFRSEVDETIVGLKIQRPRLLAGVIAGFPVLLLILQSILQLTVWDVIIVFAIFLLVYIYVLRSNVRFFGS